MLLPADTHVHSEFSWDTGGPESAAAGTMERTCAQAVRIGVPVVVFTEHLDVSAWRAAPEDFLPHLRTLIDDQQQMKPPLLEVEDYLQSIERCRHLFSDLQILTGVEFGQPHLDGAAAAAAVDMSVFDRVNGSLHTLPWRDARSEPSTLYREAEDPGQVIWTYLAEIDSMLEGDFDVFTHIDYAVRYWPSATVGPFDPRPFEDGFRQAMRSIAASGRPLEMNTGRPLRPWIPQWWSESGGRAVTFGSDDHSTDGLAANFGEATMMLEALGFRPGRTPQDYWTR